MEFPEQRDLVLQKMCDEDAEVEGDNGGNCKNADRENIGCFACPTGAPREEITQPATTGAPRNKGAKIKAWAIRFTM